MIFNYRVTDFTIGIPSVEVEGDAFHPFDLYEMVGRNQFMTTFHFKKDSDAALHFGENITGVISYDFGTKEMMASGNFAEPNPSASVLKIDSADNRLTLEQKKKLKYRGVVLGDLRAIGYLPYARPREYHGTGEKKIPNIVEIESDFSGMDHSLLLKHYLLRKANSGCELTSFEKEQLVGTILGLGDFKIDSRILLRFGFESGTILENDNVLLAAYEAKERRGSLAEEETAKLAELRFWKKIESMNYVLQEVNKAGLSASGVAMAGEMLNKIVESAIHFRPRVLLHGNKQVFWDLQSYIHIVLRHAKEYQIGSFCGKTPFPYKANDLASLIEKVLGRVEDEIRDHFESQSNEFVRRGTMSVEFNGDHFQVRIAPSGRLTQFHALGIKNEALQP